MEKVDETIDAICDWIQKELKEACVSQEKSILPEMTKALAELVSARGLNNISKPVLLNEIASKIKSQIIEELKSSSLGLHY